MGEIEKGEESTLQGLVYHKQNTEFGSQIPRPLKLPFRTTDSSSRLTPWSLFVPV